MSKLYVFGIGGTGSRVLRSLTMLLASGVECEANTIVPIIIDPDDSAANLTEAVESMKKYSAQRNSNQLPLATKKHAERYFRTIHRFRNNANRKQGTDEDALFR